MSLFEQTPSRGGSRFGRLSTNMFFIRNTAKPKRVNHIEGLNGALICNVNDDPSLIRSSPTSSLDFNRTNLPTFETPRRVERVVPPMGFWNTYGVIHDTERWKQELASLATASGLGAEKEEQKNVNKSTTAVDPQHTSRSGAHYSTRTGRFNEGNSKSRGRTGSKHATAHSDMLFNVPENEREMWMLQVLCQLLGTSNLEDIQSWLVSASQPEKEQASTMINSALRGLKESERTSNQAQEPVDLNSLSTFVERQKNEEKYASQKYVKDILNRSAPILSSIDEEQQTDVNLNNSWEGQGHNNDNSNLPLQNTTTYKRAYQNFNQQSHSSFNETPTNKKNNVSNENEENQHEDEEQIETIQLDDDRRRPRSASLTKTKKQSKKSQSPIGRPPSSHKQKHRVESIQFNDDEKDNNKINFTNENKKMTDDDDHEDEHYEKNEKHSSSNKTKPSSNHDEKNKSRKIRDLQKKLSRQEEESKQKFDELQSKQSRLENAIKLLVKQTSTYGKRRQQTHDDVEKDPDAPVVNVIIQSPRETDRRDKQNEPGKYSEPSIGHANGKSKKNQNGNNGTKLGDYTVQDVKVQISLSRLDNNHPNKVYSGIWKPDASTFQRLQGN